MDLGPYLVHFAVDGEVVGRSSKVSLQHLLACSLDRVEDVLEVEASCVVGSRNFKALLSNAFLHEAIIVLLKITPSLRGFLSW